MCVCAKLFVKINKVKLEMQLVTILIILLGVHLVHTQGTDRRPLPAGEDLSSCMSMNPLCTSKDICGDLCEPGAECLASGACVCKKEPGASMLGGHFVHCTNWDYVEQKGCRELCTKAGKNDGRVCWSGVIGNYCTCFSKMILVE